MYKRIVLVRKHQKLTQKEFGEMLGVSRDVMANIENNRVEPSSTFVQLLCSKFNVNNEWLQCGQGEMFKRDAASVVDQLTREYSLDDIDRAIIERYVELGPIQRKVIKQYIQSLTSAFVTDEVETYAMPAQGNSAAHGVVSADDKKKLGEIKNALLDEDDSGKLL